MHAVTPLHQLSLAMSWNRADVAESKIFTDDVSIPVSISTKIKFQFVVISYKIEIVLIKELDLKKPWPSLINYILAPKTKQFGEGLQTQFDHSPNHIYYYTVGF